MTEQQTIKPPASTNTRPLRCGNSLRKDITTMGTPQHDPEPGTPNPPEPVSLEEIAEHARRSHQHASEDLVRRLGSGERLTAEQIFAGLHARTLATWWGLVTRHVHARGLSKARAVAKFSAWIAPYLHDAPTGNAVPAPSVIGVGSEQELALAHLDRSLALIRQAAARDFLTQAQHLAPGTSAEYFPAHTSSQEAGG